MLLPRKPAGTTLLHPVALQQESATATGERLMSWIVLFIAGVFEVGWTIGLKYAHGFTKLGPSLATIASMAVSLGLLGLALRSLPLATAYATWTGIGIIGSALASHLLFQEALDARHYACIALIAAGIVGLKLLT